MAEASRTQGEILFEQYLATQRLEFEFEKTYPGKSKRPDYAIEWNGQPIIFEVKDFDPPESLPGSGAYDPYIGIREKINQGRDKFKEYKEFCCGLVLRNLGHPLVSLQEPIIVLGAMYGDSGLTIPVNTTTGIAESDRMKPAFLGRGKMIRPNRHQNTTISAIITLSAIRPHNVLLIEAFSETLREENARSYEECEQELRRTVPGFDPNWEVPRVIVWHNGVARISFPPDLFCGPYDTNFGIVRSDDDTVTQGITYRGGALPKSVKV